jgi:hypothetical protein
MHTEISSETHHSVNTCDKHMQGILKAFALQTRTLRPAVEPLFMEDGALGMTTSLHTIAVKFGVWRMGLY